MKIRAGFIIDYDDISMKEAGEIEETIQRQMELIVRNDPRVVHVSAGAKTRRDTRNTSPSFNDAKIFSEGEKRMKKRAVMIVDYDIPNGSLNEAMQKNMHCLEENF